MSKRIALVLPVLLAASAIRAADEIPLIPDALKKSTFKIPSPAAVEHPGAREAPASSPLTYPDEVGFQKRADIIISGLATADLQRWRKGWFRTGGDPGKYTHGPIMAKLIVDPKAADAITMENDDRSFKEFYHFACVNWSRVLPIFASILNQQTVEGLDAQVNRWGFLGQGGTENHKTMWLTSANVLPHYTKSGRLQRMGKEAALARAKKDLRTYVKGLYAAGQGEWDSSTYLMFDVNGMLNIYDFSPDAECRLLAKAALDWYLAAYALKYTNGAYCAPNQRGFAPSAVATITDRTGWLWWGSTKPVTPNDARGFNYAMQGVTSSYRPNRVLCNIAQRKLPKLAFESRNTKPNYWGISGPPVPGAWFESVFVSPHYTMGALWQGAGGQTSRFQVAAVTPTGVSSFYGGTPVGRNDGDGSLQFGRFGDGYGLFDQSVAVGRAYLMLSSLPDDAQLKTIADQWKETHVEKAANADGWAAALAQNRFAAFCAPGDAAPLAAGEWLVFSAGQTYVAVRGVAAKPQQTTTEPDRGGSTLSYYKLEGAKTGFIVETSDVTQFQTAQDFAAALAKTALDASKFATDLAVTYTSVAGKKIELQYQPGQRRAAASIDAKPVSFANWPIYDGPYIKHTPGVLTVTDGAASYTIDFTADLPIYR